MTEPSPRASRFTIALAALVLVALAIGSFILGRSTVEPRRTIAPAIVAVPSAPVVPLPVVLPKPEPLGRTDVIAAARAAADAYAAAAPLPEAVAALAGRDFEVRLPFACPGAPPPGPDGSSAVYDPAAKALRLRAEPVRWPPAVWLPPPAGEAAPIAETIEGFWIARPWTSSGACPTAPADVSQVAAEQSLGIAQFHTPAASRIGRRDGKAYEAVERVPPEAVDLSAGLLLRLRGKIAKRADVPPVLCRGPGSARPTCLVAVDFDEIAIENAATGATLETWDVAGPSASVFRAEN